MLLLEFKMKSLNNKKSYKSNMTKISQNWLDVLIPFSYEYNKKFSGSEISRLVKLPQKSTSRYLNKLVLLGILNLEKKGNSNFYYLDLGDEKISIILNLVESYKSFLFSQNNFLWKDLKELMRFGTFILFGSQVKGYSNEKSDIDLVIFSKNTEKLKEKLRQIPNIQAQVITFNNFEKLVFKKDVLALEILKNHVIFGNFGGFINLVKRFYNG